MMGLHDLVVVVAGPADLDSSSVIWRISAAFHFHRDHLVGNEDTDQKKGGYQPDSPN